MRGPLDSAPATMLANQWLSAAPFERNNNASARETRASAQGMTRQRPSGSRAPSSCVDNSNADCATLGFDALSARREIDKRRFEKERKKKKETRRITHAIHGECGRK